MADDTVVHIGENSPEQVAMKLLPMIALSEGKKLAASTVNTTPFADRKWILDTFAECMKTVRHPVARLDKGS